MKKHLFLTALVIIALTAIIVGAPEPAHVAGTWNFSASVAGRNISETFVLIQEGDTITGSFAPNSKFIGTGPLKGKIEENRISFQVTTSHGTDDYTGTIDGDTMKGTVRVGTSTNAIPWTAKQTR